MSRFFITTLGCKVNQYESEAIEARLKAKGMTDATDEKASVCIVNTCSVTQKAAMQSRQAIRHAIRSHPDARIVVTGCYAQTEPEKIISINGVHDVIGHSEKLNIPELVSLQTSERSGLPHSPPRPSPSLRQQGRTRPFIKIQDGCDAFCTYCIVPLARGRSRSVPASEIYDQIRSLKKAGYQEVVLTGIHMGRYGHDLTPKTSLLELLGRITATDLIHRVRLSSIEPLELSEPLIRLAKDAPGICRHFHIPLQSGDDPILKKMGRPYTRTRFKELILYIHRFMPDAAIGLDTLIGFPGETQAAFERTYDLVEALPVSYLHVFPFSPREGTPAAVYPDQVPIQTIQNRCSALRALGAAKKRAFYERFIGQSAEVLIENKRDRSTHMLVGLTSNYLRVLIQGESHLKNRLVPVEFTGITDAPALLGTL